MHVVTEEHSVNNLSGLETFGLRYELDTPLVDEVTVPPTIARSSVLMNYTASIEIGAWQRMFIYLSEKHFVFVLMEIYILYCNLYILVDRSN